MNQDKLMTAREAACELLRREDLPQTLEAIEQIVKTIPGVSTGLVHISGIVKLDPAARHMAGNSGIVNVGNSTYLMRQEIYIDSKMRNSWIN
jgi:hypothetical protein